MADLATPTHVAWEVTFRRYRLTPSYKAETLIVVSDDDSLAALLDALRAVHPEAQMDTANRLGEAVVA